MEAHTIKNSLQDEEITGGGKCNLWVSFRLINSCYGGHNIKRRKNMVVAKSQNTS